MRKATQRGVKFQVGDYVREVDGDDRKIGKVVHVMRDAGLVVVTWPPSRTDPRDLVLV
jgi:hypothetical protein